MSSTSCLWYPGPVAWTSKCLTKVFNKQTDQHPRKRISELNWLYYFKKDIGSKKIKTHTHTQSPVCMLSFATQIHTLCRACSCSSIHAYVCTHRGQRSTWIICMISLSLIFWNGSLWTQTSQTRLDWLAGVVAWIWNALLRSAHLNRWSSGGTNAERVSGGAALGGRQGGQEGGVEMIYYIHIWNSQKETLIKTLSRTLRCSRWCLCCLCSVFTKFYGINSICPRFFLIYKLG